MQTYRGRFAPSPTGSLHLGSLLTAIASYCDAKKNNGTWLVRIEDLDPPREIAGASKKIITSLNNCGFEFDQNTLTQSQRLHEYHQACKQLELLEVTYKCPCTRGQLSTVEIPNHSCRTMNTLLSKGTEHSLRFKVPNQTLEFIDKIQGPMSYHLTQDCGDFILKRKDGLIAYQLAVTVDDHFQKITHVIRGMDLIDSTPWQILIHQSLYGNYPHYAHVPILVNSQGQKLSKQTHAKEIDLENPLDVLYQAYQYLQQTPFIKKPQTINQFWQHAIQHWNINNITNIASIEI